jgi:hypothetical protein
VGGPPIVTTDEPVDTVVDEHGGSLPQLARSSLLRGIPELDLKTGLSSKFLQDAFEWLACDHQCAGSGFGAVHHRRVETRKDRSQRCHDTRMKARSQGGQFAVASESSQVTR